MRASLGTDFTGDIVEAGDSEYELVRNSVFASGSPRYVVRPRSVRDVQSAVLFARRERLALAVRGGGHSFSGYGTNDGGIVIDLSRLDRIEMIDRGCHMVRIGGGATWGRVADTLDADGLAISSGDTRSVGVGGLTLGGGIGWKVRKHGLALDSLVGAEVVLADGEVVHCSVDTEPDLFWALRGGGGNFGIVTAFEFRAQPTTEVFFGTIRFPATDAHRIVRGWADHLSSAPADLSSTVALANPFAGGPGAPVEIQVAFDGDDAATANAAIDPLRRLGTVLHDDVELMPSRQTLVEGTRLPPGMSLLTRSAFVVSESVPEALRVITDLVRDERSPFITIRAIGGALSRVPDDATAFAYRRAELLVIASLAGPTAVVEAAAAAFDGTWMRLAAATVGAYVNFSSTGLKADVDAGYPPHTYRRLREAKRRYDPDNLFAGNLNVAP